jgi:predicted ABC-class ATPase
LNIKWTREKAVCAAGWRDRPQSACRKSFRFVTYESIKDSTVVKKTDIEIFIITKCNRIQTAL